jgi:alcohol oxidase
MPSSTGPSSDIFRDIHGFDGPIKVSFGNHTYPITHDFLRAAESQGIPTTDDLQDLVTAQ